MVTVYIYILYIFLNEDVFAEITQDWNLKYK